jgi:hypothetical protein
VQIISAYNKKTEKYVRAFRESVRKCYGKPPRLYDLDHPPCSIPANSILLPNGLKRCSFKPYLVEHAFKTADRVLWSDIDTVHRRKVDWPRDCDVAVTVDDKNEVNGGVILFNNDKMLPMWKLRCQHPIDDQVALSQISHLYDTKRLPCSVYNDSKLENGHIWHYKGQTQEHYESLRANRVVIYTCLAGKGNIYDPLHHPEHVDFVCFTDQPIKSDVWEVRGFDYLGKDNTRTAKHPKILPHEYFDHKYSVFIDADVICCGEVNWLMLERLLFKHDMAMYRHELRPEGTVYDEFQACVEAKLDDYDTMLNQMERYEAEGYTGNAVFHTAKILFRRDTPQVRKAMKAWWEEIENGSRRDQLSAPYAFEKTGLKVQTINDFCRQNKYFVCVKFAPAKVKRFLKKKAPTPKGRG